MLAGVTVIISSSRLNTTLSIFSPFSLDRAITKSNPATLAEIVNNSPSVTTIELIIFCKLKSLNTGKAISPTIGSSLARTLSISLISKKALMPR